VNRSPSFWVLLAVEALLLIGCYAPPFAGVGRRIVGTAAGLLLLALGLAQRQGILPSLGETTDDARAEGRFAPESAIMGAICAAAWLLDLPHRI
jgi:hypothetical protein